MGLFKKKINSRIINEELNLEKHDEELLHRIHADLLKEVEEDKKELIAEENFLKLVKNTEDRAVKLRNILKNIQQLVKMEEDLITKVGPLSRSKIYRELYPIAQKLLMSEEEAEREIEQLRKEVDHIKNVANKIGEEKSKDKRIEEFIEKWSKNIESDISNLEKIMKRELKKSS